ncbi:MAG TPA: response regulator transcription factor [bacterium]|jgi:two-component system nitrate/nitrite response regulator NarL
MIRVLIVDDQAAYRSAMRRLLAREQDFEIVGEAADGLEAVQQAELLKPDVVLMDFSMPLLDGVTAATEIQRKVPTVKIFIISAYADTLDAGKIMRAGFMLLDKALTAEEIVSAVRMEAAGTSSASED